MPSPPAESHHPDQVKKLLHQHGATHLRSRKHGSAVIVESGPARDPIKHFRLRRDTVHLWWLDMADLAGSWERTPFRGQLEQLVKTIIENFSWTLAPRE